MLTQTATETPAPVTAALMTPWNLATLRPTVVAHPIAQTLPAAAPQRRTHVQQLLCPSSLKPSEPSSGQTTDASAAASTTLATSPVTAQAPPDHLTALSHLSQPVAGPSPQQKTEWRGDGLFTRFATISTAA